MRRAVIGILLVICVAFLSFSVYHIVEYLAQEKQSSDTYEELRSIYEAADSDDAADHNSSDQGQNDGDSEQNPDESGNHTSAAQNTAGSGTDTSGTDQTASDDDLKMMEGLKALHEENADCIGWIHIEDTAIDYPVMYHPSEEEYYLHRNFYKESDSSGTPYLSEICDPDDSDNLIIYGHHMNSGTMFAALEKYKEEDFWKTHPTIEFTTLQGKDTYQILAAFALEVGTDDDFEYYNFAKAASEEEFTAFVDECRNLSYYDTGLTASYGDKLITLSTCEYSHKNGRMVVVGKRVE